MGVTRIEGLLDADDVRATARAVQMLGAKLFHEGGASWRVEGAGEWREPGGDLNLGNSGTGCRLLMGAAAGYPITARFVGDDSLSRRPMRRVLDPLMQMGARAELTHDGLPATLIGADALTAITWDAGGSAQVKSALLLAGLNAQGETIVAEPFLSRDHTERMLNVFDVNVDSNPMGDGWRHVVTGKTALTAPAKPIRVPGDPSSAAFFAAAAMITNDSEITLSDVSANPLRNEALRFMTAWSEDGAFAPTPAVIGGGAGEPVADYRFRSSSGLKAREIKASDMPNAIDETPILAVVAAFAEGTTQFIGFDDLRHKESDRIATTCAMLNANGVDTREWDDGFAVIGCGPSGPQGGGRVITHHDHRIAMSALVLGLGAKEPVGIDDASTIATSFPSFIDSMTQLGAHIEASEQTQLGSPA